MPWRYLRGLSALHRCAACLGFVLAHGRGGATVMTRAPIHALRLNGSRRFVSLAGLPLGATVAARVHGCCKAGYKTASYDARGLITHFRAAQVAYPAADIPALQLSLQRDLDAATHMAIGRALAPLRDEGVFIVGSGMSYHNMRGFGGRGSQDADEFDAWLRAAATAEPAERARLLASWSTAPKARAAHPREEHLLPLMVIAGAAGEDQGRTAYNDTFAGVRVSAFHYG